MRCTYDYSRLGTEHVSQVDGVHCRTGFLVQLKESEERIPKLNSISFDGITQYRSVGTYPEIYVPV